MNDVFMVLVMSDSIIVKCKVFNGLNAQKSAEQYFKNKIEQHYPVVSSEDEEYFLKEKFFADDNGIEIFLHKPEIVNV